MAQDDGGATPQGEEIAIVTDYRPFSRMAKETSDNWFRHPIQRIGVRQLDPYIGGADGACRVQLNDGRIGFVKPRPDRASLLTVAREKIVADLAHLLGIPVPPVVIRMPTTDWPHHTALSLSVLPGGRLWQNGGVDRLARLAPYLEALRVFWTWVCDEDHNGHGENLVWEVMGPDAIAVGIDHSYALNYRGIADPLTINTSGGYGTDKLPGCEAVRVEVLQRIEGLQWDEVEKIVRRLSDILTPQEQDGILALLEARRKELRRRFSA